MLLTLAWRNIWRHARRTQLTLAAMVFANIILVFMISMQSGMYNMMINNTLRITSGHLQIQSDGYHDHPAIYKTVSSGSEIAEDLRERIGNIAAARTSSYALFASEQRTYGALLFGVEVEHESQVSSLPGLVKEGRYLRGRHDHEIVIGSVLARNLQVEVGDELTLLGSAKDGSIAADIVTISGLFETGNKDADRMLAHMPLAVFQQVFSMQQDVHSIVITAESLQHSEQIAAAIDTPAGAVLLDWQDLESGLLQAIEADIGSAAFVYLILVVLSGFSVLNTVLMTVLERTREFGVFMALGLRPSQLAGLIFLETVLLASIGLVLGVIIGGLLALYFEFNGLYIPGYEDMAAQFNLPPRMHPQVDTLSLMLGPGFIFLSAIIATLYPALKIYTLKPLDALHTPN